MSEPTTMHIANSIDKLPGEVPDNGLAKASLLCHIAKHFALRGKLHGNVGNLSWLPGHLFQTHSGLFLCVERPYYVPVL